MAAACCYITGTYLVKTSILALYQRLFACKKHFNRLIWMIAVFILTDHIIQIFLTILNCLPVNATWNMAVRGTCINRNLAAIILGSINVLIDVVLLVLPMPLVWKLNIPLKFKLQLIGIFLLGGL